jgi:hypothetical protein
MMPVTAIAGETGGVKAKHRADLAGAESGDQLLETRARHGSARGTAQVVVDNLDIPKSSAARFIGEFILTPLAFEMDLNLCLSGLTHIHDRLAAQDRRWQGISIHHRRSPRGSRRRLPSEDGQDVERRCRVRRLSSPSTPGDAVAS